MFPPKPGMMAPQQMMMRSAMPSRSILANAKRPKVNARPKLKLNKKIGPRVKI